MSYTQHLPDNTQALYFVLINKCSLMTSWYYSLQYKSTYTIYRVFSYVHKFGEKSTCTLMITQLICFRHMNIIFIIVWQNKMIWMQRITIASVTIVVWSSRSLYTLGSTDNNNNRKLQMFFFWRHNKGKYKWSFSSRLLIIIHKLKSICVNTFVIFKDCEVDINEVFIVKLKRLRQKTHLIDLVKYHKVRIMRHLSCVWTV